MKKAIAFIVAMIFALGLSAVVFAAEEQVPVATPAQAEKKEAAPAKPAIKKMSVTGEVTAIDANAMTLTVKGRKGDVALMAEEKTKVVMGKEKKTLADVKVGDKITVSYIEKDGKMAAKSITIKTVAKPMEKAVEVPAPAHKK